MPRAYMRPRRWRWVRPVSESPNTQTLRITRKRFAARTRCFSDICRVRVLRDSDGGGAPLHVCHPERGHRTQALAQGTAARRTAVTYNGMNMKSAPARVCRQAHAGGDVTGVLRAPVTHLKASARWARCSETRPVIHLRKHPERRAAAGMSLATAVPAARSRRRPPERSRRRPPERSRRALPLTNGAQAPFDCAHRRLRVDALRSGCLRLLCALPRRAVSARPIR